MKNFDYEKKYHYLIKYILIGLLPIILIFGSLHYDANLYDFLYSFCNELLNLNINSFYLDILDLLSFNFTSKLGVILITIPLFTLWLYVFDLIIDIIGFIPKLANKLLHRLGGGY